MTCLETDFLIELSRGESKAHARLKELRKAGAELTVTPVSIAEFMFGAYKFGSEQKLKESEAAMKTLAVLEFDFYAAKEAGKLFCELEKAGSKIGDMDTLTAAVALRHGEKIVTRNAKHFGKVKGLEILKW